MDGWQKCGQVKAARKGEAPGPKKQRHLIQGEARAGEERPPEELQS